MRALSALLLAALLSGSSAPAAEPVAEQSVQTVFTELRALKPMQPGQSYTVPVGGVAETGPKERFLRRRSAAEVSASGLSCGCGDYALLFIDRIEALGFTTLLVDGAEISSGSLLSHFSGHAVVAMRAKETAADTPWWLVDSTNLKVLSRNWSPAETSFQAFGHVFWIGYCGPLAGYPVHGPDDLMAFYTRTLAAVPLEFFNRNLSRLKFTVDPSLIGPDGKFLNPRLERFLHLQEEILANYHIAPQRETAILLIRGEDNATSDLKRSETGGWTGHLGLHSACSPGLLAYFEQAVRRTE